MPTYHARSITVRLGSLPLAETTTSDVVLKKGEVAKRQTEAAEKKLLRSFLLDEKRVLFPGDPDGYELNWLGNAPFMQVQADAGVSQSSGLYRGAHRPYASEDNRLRALSLHVKLSDKAFVSGFAGKTHLKIEVLFNGQLSTCSLVHTNDIRSGAKSFHQVFAGSRVDFLAERPWVLLPPYTTADGGTRRFRKTITPPERWSQISTAILEEADERGTNRAGKASPSAEFLRALAKMRMPDAVTNMQKPGGRKFGIVDVLITAGTGNKLTTGTNYLKKPQRLRDPTYAVRAEAAVEDEIDTVELDRVQHTTYDPLRETDIDRLDASADERADSDDERERPRKRRALSPPVTLSKPAAHDETVQSPFCGAQVPYLPPPDRSMSKNGLSSVAGTLVSRLVITGLEDKVIVDHRWKVAQRILTNQTGMARGKKTIPKPERDSTTTRSCARKQSSHHAGTSLSRSRAKSFRKKPQRDAVQQRVPEQRRDSVQDGQTSQSHEVSLPYLKKHERPANEELPINPKIDVPDKIAPFVTAPFLNLATLTSGSTCNHTTELITSSALSMPQRRTLSRINLPGVQGPKAASFLLDDPEEMLREAARMRRSRSPTKPTITPSVLSSTPPTQLKATTRQEGTGGSSPLSSVPSSPAPAAASTIDEAAGAAVDQISQLDGSPERTLPATSPRKVSKSSPTKSILPRPSPATPQSSPSPESRKRKGITNRSYTKPPHSPGRLKTVENPPLNNDCVIAFAESKGKNEERGVLRQVKGERQGVFKEEYVALAVRFFIAGD
ncbi:hypothetical protein SLS59_006274 [Nothophoma quercina]|uniref:Uncharacterized protein n=1 Tax=Nothophoma quercina TaxID=749835 RepID=A0ABR3R4G5_9PLEO